MSRTKPLHSGRKSNNERIRELVALLGSLSKTGDSVTLDAISKRMGMTLEEAESLMNIVCQASSEEWGGLLISSNDEGTEFTLQYPGTRGRPGRLTKAESIALVHALDLAGIPDDDPLRQKLHGAFASPQVDESTVRRALGVGSEIQHSPLFLCAQSEVERKSLTFLYQGLKDASSRERRAVVRGISLQDGNWYISALDIDLCENRTFRVDRMLDVALGASFTIENSFEARDQTTVGITFKDPAYYTMFDWPGLRVIRITPEEIYGELPYYGECSTWLLRRICAGKGSIIVDDERIMNLARAYASRLLSECS